MIRQDPEKKGGIPESGPEKGPRMFCAAVTNSVRRGKRQTATQKVGPWKPRWEGKRTNTVKGRPSYQNGTNRKGDPVN